MCQFGAIGRARAGQKHDTILTTYYPGTELTRLYQ
jgi:peptidoglycan hydrolase-like amidase